MSEKILEVIKKARESKKRNFKQTFDLAINLRNIDLKKSENRIKTDIIIPNGFGKDVKIGVMVDSLIPQAKDLSNIILIRKDEIEKLGKNKKEAKNIANTCRFFIAEAPLMPLVGKNLGPILAPRNKMPFPIPPTANLKPIIERFSKTLRIVLKDSPTIHCPVGTEDMDDQKIAENVDAIIKGVINALPKGREQVKNLNLKLTMGNRIKFNM